MICSIYKSLFEKLQKMNFNEHLTITADDIDEWCSDKVSNNESCQLAYARKQKYGRDMIFAGISYSYYMRYMGTWLASYMALWKIPCSPLERSDTKLIACITQSRDALPGYGNRKIFSKFKEKYKYAIGGSVPLSMLRNMYKDLSQDALSTCK